MGLTSFLAALTLFWALVYLAYRYRRSWFEERSVEVQVPVILWRVTTRLQWFEKAREKRMLGRIGGICVALTVLSAGLYYWFIGGIAYKRLVGEASQNGVVLLIPGLTIWGTPLLYFLLAASIAILVHELAHAVVAGMEGVKLRSAGLALFLVFPAAFVEPDEDSFNKARLSSKLKILAAGSAANIILGALFLGLLAYTLAAPAGVVVTAVEKGSPAEAAGITPGMRIVAINGSAIHRITDLRASIRPGENATLIFTVVQGSVTRNITVFKPAGRRLIGIYFKPSGTMLSALSTSSYEAILNIVNWSYMINFSLALVNAAPLFITDGGKMLDIYLRERLGEEKRAAIPSYTLQTLTLLLLILALAPMK